MSMDAKRMAEMATEHISQPIPPRDTQAVGASIGEQIARKESERLTHRSVWDWLLPWRAKARMRDHRRLLALQTHLKQQAYEMRLEAMRKLEEARSALAHARRAAIEELAVPASEVMHALVQMEASITSEEVGFLLKVKKPEILYLPSEQAQLEMLGGILSIHGKQMIWQAWQQIRNELQAQGNSLLPELPAYEG